MAENPFDAARQLPEEQEQQLYLELLRKLIAARGGDAFTSNPVLEPTKACFPDPWNGDIDSIRKVTQRLMNYAGMDEAVELHIYDHPAANFHSGPVAYFGGIENHVCKISLDIKQIGPLPNLVAALSHEIAHAFRERHKLADNKHDHEEELTDITAIYLGFGFFIVNASERYEKTAANAQFTLTSYSSTGYLAPQAACFLLAAQLFARGWSKRDVSRFVRNLEPNQAAYVKTAFSYFASNPDVLIGIPIIPGSNKQQNPQAVAFRDEDLRVSVFTQIVETPKRNKGKPVFRVAAHRSGRRAIVDSVGGILGLFAGLAVGFSLETVWYTVPFAALGIGLAEWWLRKMPDRCSAPNCDTALPPAAQQCPGCGGNIVGHLDSPQDHLEAEENYRRAKRRSKGK